MSSCRAVFKNNLAYTEDNVLIYNIFVLDLSKKCTENMIRSYFTRFGEVVGVHKKLATASVHFKDACSAYKALVKSIHQIGGKRIAVEAGDSWKQPDADKVLGRTGSYNGDSEDKNEQHDAPTTSSEPPSNALTLLSLNDDCLEIICGGTFNDSLICKFLSGLSQLKKLSLDGCTNIETKNLIKICEAMKNLKALNVRNCNVTSDFFETMADHCLELEVLIMSCEDFSFDCVPRLPSLKHLELTRISNFQTTLPTTLLTELVAHKADQLESLKCFGVLTVDDFTAISELKQLKIFYCDINNLRGGDLLKLSKLELLEELGIENACNITNEALLRLLQNCTRLHLIYTYKSRVTCSCSMDS